MPRSMGPRRASPRTMLSAAFGHLHVSRKPHATVSFNWSARPNRLPDASTRVAGLLVVGGPGTAVSPRPVRLARDRRDRLGRRAPDLVGPARGARHGARRRVGHAVGNGDRADPGYPFRGWPARLRGRPAGAPGGSGRAGGAGRGAGPAGRAAQRAGARPGSRRSQPRRPGGARGRPCPRAAGAGRDRGRRGTPGGPSRAGTLRRGGGAA